MSPLDRLLAQYSQPQRSWPGEEGLDEEAIANYAAMHPKALPRAPWERDDVLPLARSSQPLPITTPDQWRSTSDVMKALNARLDHRPWSLAWPKMLTDVGDAAETVSAAPVLDAIQRPSQMSPERFEQFLAHGMAGAMTGMTGGVARAAAAPRLGVGEMELGIFGGRRGAENLAAKGETRPLQALDMLERMEKEGKSREEIWTATNEILKDSPYAGAFRGKDTKPRFEIDDSGAHKRWFNLGRLGNTISHDALFAAYPDLASVRTRPLSRSDDLRVGYYDPGRTGWTVNFYSQTKPAIEFPRRESIGFRRGEGALSHLLHEAQHAGPQKTEGFARGSGMLDPDYRLSSGEVEARAVQSRKDLTPDQRRSRAPWLDYDVPESQQIVRFGSEGPQMSKSESPLPMDEASRLARAREMGFDLEDPSLRWFHSSLSPIDEFKPHGKFMGRHGVSGISLTDNPEMANRYLDRFGDYGWVDGKPNQPFHKNVMPLVVKKGMNIRDIDKPIAQKLGLGAPLPADYKWPKELDGVDAVRVRDAINAPGRTKGSDSELLADLGFGDIADKVMHTRLDDPGAIRGHELIVRDPRNIRSVNAAFDPAKKNSANILASHRVPIPVPREDDLTVEDILNLYTKD